MADFNFEESFKRLEDITTAMENNDLSLDDMISLYTEGVELSAKCSKALDEAKLKITKLSGAEDD